MLFLYILLIIIVLYNLFILIKSLLVKEINMYGFFFFKYLLGWLFKIYYPFEVEGLENIKDLEGPIIVAGNHRHLLDQCLPILCIDKPIHYMAKKEYFDSFKTRWFFKLAGCISVDRKNHDEVAKEKAINILKNNHVLGIFPEGTRNRTKDKLLPFKFGCVSMAKKTDATIIPFAISGKYKHKNNNLKIKFGEPFKVSDDLEESNKKLYNVILDLYNKE